jgi:hypothetical protein
MSENTRRLIRERAMRDRERARASKARAWRPEDYEPDWDGPVNAEKRAMWPGRERA